VKFNLTRPLVVDFNGPIVLGGWRGWRRPLKRIPNTVSLRGSFQVHAGQALLIPLFLAGNSTPTIPQYSASARVQASRLAALTQLLLAEDGAAISMRLTRSCGKRRSKQHLGGLTIEETTGRKNAVREERLKRRWETRQCHKAANGALIRGEMWR
jgi:hypothetical protein